MFNSRFKQFARPVPISAPCPVGPLGAAHRAADGMISPPIIRSQHASVVPLSSPSVKPPGNRRRPSPSDAAGSRPASPAPEGLPAPQPIDFPSPPPYSPVQTLRPPTRPPRHSLYRKPVSYDDIETLRDSQYSSECSDTGSPAVYEPSAEEVAQFAVLARASIVPDRQSIASDEEKHTVLDKGKGRAADDDDDDDGEHNHHSRHTGSYPINIDEWAAPLSPDLESANSKRLAVPSRLNSSSSPSLPAGFTVTPGFEEHRSDTNLSDPLARTNSFNESAASRRPMPHRAPPPPLKLAKSNGSLDRESTPSLVWRRNSEDSIGVSIETHRPNHRGSVWANKHSDGQWDEKHADLAWDAVDEEKRPELHNVTLTPFTKEASYSTEGSHKSSLVGILKPKRSDMQEQKRWVVGLVLLNIVIVVIVVPFKLKEKPKKAGVQSSDTSPPQESFTGDIDVCLSPFLTGGHSIGPLFPCGSCRLLLANHTNDFLNDVDTTFTGVGSLKQFCALMDVLFGSSVTSLHARKWGADMDVCSGWGGVRCDERKRITTLDMVYPGVPTELPGSFRDLVSLRTFRVVGDGQRPRGLLPPGIPVLPNITTLDLQYTALGGAIPNVSHSLRNLTMMANPTLKPPINFSTIPLEALVLADQNITSLPSLPSSLRVLDLSYNSLNGSLSNLLALPYLKSLYLQHNDLVRFIPPPGAPIESLSLAGNPRLTGGLWRATCDGLRACDARGTAMGRNCSRCYYEE
ncbi:hypothetical protein CspeluHIS016_0306980 [Cutaneotrichosporon spelunceum]|uniref:L domain-like protein n=1 Tax=Cutaneotrichosporon spelunceum TaxID=1672016 RepID=A0AAD3YC82_9TREE|nr:hypothetical protein CspeluHIS016_0306980 [Cutaneotrichosporon spelunceum]